MQILTAVSAVVDTIALVVKRDYDAYKHIIAAVRVAILVLYCA